MATFSLPAATERDIGGVIERIITEIPASSLQAGDAEAVVRSAARRAALVSGSLALPPGPLGIVTVLPDIYLIWRIQRQMVADLFALEGRSGELTRTHMLYCLFRHAASQVLRDVAVRAGQRFVVRELSSGAMRATLGPLANAVSTRVIGTSAGRLVPAIGAAAVAAYAHWDTRQVAKSARVLLAKG